MISPRAVPPLRQLALSLFWLHAAIETLLWYVTVMILVTNFCENVKIFSITLHELHDHHWKMMVSVLVIVSLHVPSSFYRKSYLSNLFLPSLFHSYD